VGVLFAVGLYMMMQKTMLRVVVGGNLLSYGTFLALILSGGLNKGMVPVLVEGVEEYVDPVPQALILTAIVIGFGMTAFQLALAYRTYQETGTDDLDELRHEDEGNGAHE
jgi:Multisubunit Na+/H+ antiporter, MnhC subunit